MSTSPGKHTSSQNCAPIIRAALQNTCQSIAWSWQLTISQKQNELHNANPALSGSSRGGGCGCGCRFANNVL